MSRETAWGAAGYVPGRHPVKNRLLEPGDSGLGGELLLCTPLVTTSMTSPPRDRLRAPARHQPFHVALLEPEIPPNTGNVARLCAATCCPLHLIGPLGFRVDDKAVRRAGLDYWHLVEVRQHASLANLEAERPGGRTWLFTGKAKLSYLDVPFELGDLLLFGKESVGLPDELLDQRPDHCVGIPTLGAVRSLNLANSVAIALFEALRQTGCLGQSSLK